MIEVTDELKEAFFDRDNARNLVIEFNDSNNTSIDVSDILAGSFSLQQTLSTEDQFDFGQVSSASFEVTTIKSAFEYKGLECTLTMYAGDYSVQLGKFKIAEDVLSDNRLQRKLTAYDALYEKLNIDVSSWYDGLTFPMTLKAFRNSLFNYIGIEQVIVDLPNDSITIEQAIDTSATALNFKTVINQICEINACMGCLNYEGKFRYIFFNQFGRSYPSDDIFPSDDLYPSDGVSEVISTSGEGALIQQGSYVYKGYMCERISKVIIRENSSDTGTSYGDGTNVYTIEGNIFCLGNSATKNRQIAKNFYNVAFDSTYKPAKVTTQVLPWLEPGDIIEVVGNGGVTSVFPILDRTMSGIVSATDSYLANGSEKRTENVNSFSAQLKQVKSQTLTLSADVSQVKSQLDVIADDYVTSAVMQQSIEGASAEIELSVENSYSKKAEIIANINGTQQSEVKINADKITLEGLATINNNFVVAQDGSVKCSGKNFMVDISNADLFESSIKILSPTGGSVTHGSGMFNVTSAEVSAGAGQFECSWYEPATGMSSFTFVQPDYIMQTNSTKTSQSFAYMTSEYVGYMGADAYFNTVTQSSDARLKENIDTLAKDDSESLIYGLRPVQFTWKNNSDKGRIHHGFIAQELKELIGDNDLAMYSPPSEQIIPTQDGDRTVTNYAGINYTELIPDLVAVVQKQHEEIEELKEKINELQEKGVNG